MEVDVRKHKGIRDTVHAGLSALRVQGRQIWGAEPTNMLRTAMLGKIILRLQVGVGDLARLARDGVAPDRDDGFESWDREAKKELGNIVLSTVRWIDDLGFDALECIDLAVDAQEKYARSARPR
jgi:hypothetical protein